MGSDTYRRDRFVMLWFGFLFFSTLTLTGCEVLPGIMTNNARHAVENLSQPFSQAEVEAFIGASIPDNASNVHTAGEAALDTMVIVRFDLPLDDVEAYLQTLGVSNPLTDGYTPFFSTRAPYREAEDWWQIPEVESNSMFRGVNQQANGKVYKVLVVNPNAEVVTVYMQVFNT